MFGLQSSRRSTKELEKLQDLFNGIKYMERVPDVIIVVDQTLEMTAIQEATVLNIPIISILDTNCDPDQSFLFLSAI